MGEHFATLNFRARATLTYCGTDTEVVMGSINLRDRFNPEELEMLAKARAKQIQQSGHELASTRRPLGSI